MAKTEDFDVEELKRLSPKERLERLKKLEEKRNKEKEEAEGLIQESIKELQIQEEMEQVEVPAQKKVDVDKLFESEQDESLEETVSKEVPDIDPEELMQRQYNISISDLTSDETYDNLKKWQQEAQQGGLSEQYKNTVNEVYKEVNAAISAMERAGGQYQTGSDKTWDRLMAERNVLRKIRKYEDEG